jgi:hypothetical protein
MRWDSCPAHHTKVGFPLVLPSMAKTIRVSACMRIKDCSSSIYKIGQCFATLKEMNAMGQLPCTPYQSRLSISASKHAYKGLLFQYLNCTAEFRELFDNLYVFEEFAPK